MRHALLVLALDEAEAVHFLQQSLTDAGHVAVAEDAECSAEECVVLAVALDLLHLEESDNRLSDRQGDFPVACHRIVPF